MTLIILLSFVHIWKVADRPPRFVPVFWILCAIDSSWLKKVVRYFCVVSVRTTLSCWLSVTRAREDVRWMWRCVPLVEPRSHRAMHNAWTASIDQICCRYLLKALAKQKHRYSSAEALHLQLLINGDVFDLIAYKVSHFIFSDFYEFKLRECER